MRKSISIKTIYFKRGSTVLPLFFSSGYAKKKKHQVSPLRLADLKRSGNIYIIRCITGDCTCREKCTRGFFSLFLQVLYGIRFALRHQLPYYIDFGNGQYAYSDPENFDGDFNFWNYYFEQSLHKTDILKAKVATANLLYETYPLRIWHKSFIKELSHITHQHIVLKNQIKTIIDHKLQVFKQQKILGVHIRGTDHPTEIEPVPLSKFIKVIDKKRSAFDKIFLATDDENILNILVKKYGYDIIIYHQATRSSSKVAIHTAMSFQNPYQLGLEALIDCYCLAHCTEAILVHSNLSYAALVINPDLTYTLMETQKSAIKRIKSNLLYTLDQWGIRTL
jgi:hypothetical protein